MPEDQEYIDLHEQGPAPTNLFVTGLTFWQRLKLCWFLLVYERVQLSNASTQTYRTVVNSPKR